MENAKLKSWADQLLDTGKRNNLINYRHTKRTSVEVLLPTIDELYVKLRNDVSLTIHIPEYQLAKNEIEAKSEFLARNQNNMQKNEILVYSDKSDFRYNIKSIAKKAHVFIDETGVNVTYVALGFVHWTENLSSDYKYRAPLILIPIHLTQGSAIEPYTLSYTGDDIIINPTFSYKLANDYDINLPDFDDDFLLSEYFDQIACIVNKLGWTLTNEAVISLFSFQKINMYKDLHAHEDLILENKNVQYLLGEESEEDALLSFGVNADGIKNPLIELHNVVDADSSQIDAIRMAKAGRSFVLQGPPGTGKSQTITNIIAECIYDGKRILFVSEKLAALNVVFDKLRSIGLSDFCLELHSHKANKKEVIAELNRTLELPPVSVLSAADDILYNEDEQRKKLDLYAYELHKKHDYIDLSLYQLYEKYAKVSKATWVEFNIPEIERKGKIFLAEAIRLLEQYSEYASSYADYKCNPWYGFIVKDMSYAVRKQVIDDLHDISISIEQLEDLLQEIASNYGISGNAYEEACAIRNFFSFIANNEYINPSIFDISNQHNLLKQFADFSSQSEKVLNVKTDILSVYRTDILEIDYESYETKLRNIYSSSIKRLFSKAYKQIIKTISGCRKDGAKVSYSDAIDILGKIRDLRSLEKSFELSYTVVSNNLGTKYKGLETDWKAAIKAINDLSNLSGRFDVSYFSRMPLLEYEISKNMFGKIANQLYELLDRISNLKKRIASYFDKSVYDVETASFDEITFRANGCINAAEKIVEWYSIRENLNSLKELGILGFVDAAIVFVEPSQLKKSFLRRFYFQWIDNIIINNAVFRDFTRVNQDWAVKRFSETDRKQFEINRSRIKSTLSHKRPSLSLMAAGSPVAILRREAQKKRKQKSVRNIFNELGELVQKLKPCFLMSPLSVSTYLDPQSIHFDMVIFDEASQVFPQDALGAIYRASQLIVVGDTKQMPPSNFFAASLDSDDDEEENDVSSFESILDICSTRFPQLRLNWHYRSRNEDLIAFSNKNFYDNTLITFPSPKVKSKGSGVDYYYVNSVYDRASRTNRDEANKVVDLIYEHFRINPERSLGIVAFSTAQQDMIDSILSERRLSNPEFEQFFFKNKNEPFFIKNLETVQGDERDTIIFSIGYGKDASGKLLMNFGPLNKEGGERRLNVAVTRAKDNVKVVTGLHYTDIDLSRTKSEGTRLLREYLDFAENGILALERSVVNNEQDSFDSDFEMEVCSVLRNNGYTVDTQVGCSGFKIDLGIRLPDTSNYVLAIECDGATYHSSRNARDRDRLRQDILEGMGWQFYRIWSTDWFKTREKAEKELLQYVGDAVGKAISIQNIDSMEDVEDSIEGNETDFEVLEVDKPLFEEFNEIDFGVYRGGGKTIQEAIHEIFEENLPVSKEYLLKAYSKEYSPSSRPTNDIRSLIRYCTHLEVLNNYTNIKEDEEYFYPVDESKIKFRMAKPGKTREIKYISPKELAAGMEEIIRQNVIISKDELYKTIAGLCGIQRVGIKVRELLDEAFSVLAGIVNYDGARISLKTGRE